jgi:hypothetical protein
MPKYAPPNAEGLKPWVVTITSFGRSHDVLIHAETAAAAKFKAIGRAQHTYGTVRRATPEDVA